jgi:DNA-binding NarL/FixJ family response regulator
VLILTTFDRDDYVYGALRAGGSGFVLKDISPEDLLAAIRVVAEARPCSRPASPVGSSPSSPGSPEPTTRAAPGAPRFAYRPRDRRPPPGR